MHKIHYCKYNFQFLVVCFIFILLSGCNNPPKEKYIKYAAELNKHLPTDLGNGVRLDKVVAASGNKFEYYYTFLTQPKESAVDYAKENKPIMIAAIKKQLEMDDFREDKMTFVYIYKTKDGNIFSKIEISPNDYK